MRILVRLLIPLALILVLLVVVDRVAAWQGQRVVADQVDAELASNGIDSAPSEVTIEGVPFLTQVVAGRYESVTVRLRDVGTSGIRLPLVELTATGVTAEVATLLQREGPVDAERVAGTATVGYASVAALPELEDEFGDGVGDVELSPGADGRLRIRLPADLFATEVTLVGTADVTAVDGAVRVEVDSLAVEESSGLPPGGDAVVEEIARRLSVEVPLPPLPYGLAVESVRAGEAGLAVAISAENVPLSR